MSQHNPDKWVILVKSEKKITSVMNDPRRLEAWDREGAREHREYSYLVSRVSAGQAGL